MKNNNQFLIIIISIFLLSIGVYFSNKQKLNTPPDLKPLSTLTGFLNGESITGADFQSEFECLTENVKTVNASENYEILYANTAQSLNSFLKKINFKEANFRFISFQTSDTSAFSVAPLEFFTNNFELDLNSGGYCCTQLSKETIVQNSTPVLVFADKNYEICNNPTNSEMLNANISISSPGWHLKFIANKDAFSLSNNLEIESVWTFPLDALSDATLIYQKDNNQALNLQNQIYWIHVIEKSATQEATSADNLETNFDITMQNMSFGIQELRIPVGQEITLNLENLDSVPHDFFIQGLAEGSEVLRTSETSTFKFTIEQAGTFQAICNFHPSMTVQIVAV